MKYIAREEELFKKFSKNVIRHMKLYSDDLDEAIDYGFNYHTHNKKWIERFEEENPEYYL